MSVLTRILSGVSKNTLLACGLFILSGTVCIAQGEKKYVRQGNRDYAKDKFAESEILYRKAIDKDKSFADPVFNTGDALYKQKKYEDAVKQFSENSSMNENKAKKSAALYNLGNSLLMSDKISESIDAYKNSLKINPDNMEAKYNLAYAQDLLKRQQQQQQQQDQNKSDQDRKQQDSKENQKNQDQNKQNQQNNEQQQQEQQQQQQQQDQQQISREDAERLLNSIANDEKKVQEKVKIAQAAKEHVRVLKNW